MGRKRYSDSQRKKIKIILHGHGHTEAGYPLEAGSAASHGYGPHSRPVWPAHNTSI